MNDEAQTTASSFRVARFGLPRLLRFLMASVATAETAELAEFQPFRRRLLILRRNIVTMLAFRALQHNIIARHNSPSLKNRG
jgi:hypothetical protein